MAGYYPGNIKGLNKYQTNGLFGPRNVLVSCMILPFYNKKKLGGHKDKSARP